MKETYFRDLLTNDIKESNIILLGIPYDLGCSCGKGASLAPKTIRELSSFLPPFTADGKSLKNNKIYDYNDVSEYSKIEDKFKEILQYDKFNLILGGDHSISIPTQKVFLEYAILKEFRGMGYASNLINEVSNYLFEEYNIRSIRLDIDPSNKKSILAANSCGFFLDEEEYESRNYMGKMQFVRESDCYINKRKKR